ncbi:MAG: hypothetical protein AB1633_02900 [Elusimicrobiota bacterium]
MKKIIVISTTIFLAGGVAFSSTYWSRGWPGRPGYGEPVIAASARAAAMANTSIANEESSLSLFTNPALLTTLENPRVDLLYNTFYLKEDRTFPVNDSYWGRMGESVYVANSNTNNYPTLSFVFPKKRMSFGLGISQVIDYSYKYLEIVRDNSYIKKNENIIERSGSLSATTVGIGLKLSEKIRLGASINQSSGKYDDRVSSVPFTSGGGTEPANISSQESVSGLSGSNISAGVSYIVRNRVNISLNYKTEMKLKGDSTGTIYTGKREITYPSTLGFGIKYQPGNVIPAVLSIDILSTAWSKLKDTAYTDAGLQDVIEYRIGIEHRFDKGLPVRLGFAVVPHYTDSEVKDNYLTFGTGYESKKMIVDFAFVFRKAMYTGKDLFVGSHASKSSAFTNDTVIDTTFGVNMGLSYKW